MSTISLWWPRLMALLVVLAALVVSSGPELQSEAAQATPQPLDGRGNIFAGSGINVAEPMGASHPLEITLR